MFLFSFLNIFIIENTGPCCFSYAKKNKKQQQLHVYINVKGKCTKINALKGVITEQFLFLTSIQWCHWLIYGAMLQLLPLR